MIEEPDSSDEGSHTAGEESDWKMLLKIIELASTDDLPDEALGEMVEAIEKTAASHKREQS